jgi:hypothetical protein
MHAAWHIAGYLSLYGGCSATNQFFCRGVCSATTFLGFHRKTLRFRWPIVIAGCGVASTLPGFL